MFIIIIDREVHGMEQQVTILVLDRLPERMRPGRTYELQELTDAGLSTDALNTANDPWHLRVPVRRTYASRKDIADYVTRNYPGVPITDVPAAELAALKKEHLDYGTYVRLVSSRTVKRGPTWCLNGKIDGRSVAAWKKKGVLAGLPELEAALDGALSECRERRGAAVFAQYMSNGKVVKA